MKMALLLNLLSFIIFSLSALAQTSPRHHIEILAKIHRSGNSIKIIRIKEGDVIPAVLDDKKLEQILSEVHAGDEAVLDGHITYHATNVEGETKLQPIFVIESISPITLERLGEIKLTEENELNPRIKSLNKGYSPLALPVTTEVASAITMTTALLLMQELAKDPNQATTTQQLNTALILGAGAMATGVFLYDQFTGKTKK